MMETASLMSEHPSMMMMKESSSSVVASPAYHPSWYLSQATSIVASLPPYSP